MKKEDTLDQLLRTRHEPTTPARLAERIVAEATAQPRTSGQQSIWQIFSELFLPKPAYAMAFTLILGVVIGWQEPLNVDQDTSDSADIIFYDEQELL